MTPKLLISLKGLKGHQQQQQQSSPLSAASSNSAVDSPLINVKKLHLKMSSSSNESTVVAKEFDEAEEELLIDDFDEDKDKTTTNSSLASSFPKEKGRVKKDALKVMHLTDFLQRLLNAAQSKDSYGIFLNPVDTNVVTDYLAVIKNPMDFSTMQSKLSQYASVEEFKSDFNLIMNNAKIYNGVGTFYFKIAEKLQNWGEKYFDRELAKVKIVLSNTGNFVDQTIEHNNLLSTATDLQHNTHTKTNLSSSSKRKKRSSQTISSLSSLSTAKPSPSVLVRRLLPGQDSPFGTFLYSSLPKDENIGRKPDGTLDLNNPSVFEYAIASLMADEEENQKRNWAIDVDLGNVLGRYNSHRKVMADSRTIPEYKFLGAEFNDNPWLSSSFAPKTDSSSSLSAAEASLIYLIYGDLKGKSYIDSLMKFVECRPDCPGIDNNSSSESNDGRKLVHSYVHGLLDMLSLGGISTQRSEIKKLKQAETSSDYASSIGSQLNNLNELQSQRLNESSFSSASTEEIGKSEEVISANRVKSQIISSMLQNEPLSVVSNPSISAIRASISELHELHRSKQQPFYHGTLPPSNTPK